MTERERPQGRDADPTAAPAETGSPAASDAVGRARLLALRAEAEARRDALGGDVAAIVEASKDSNADDEHDPDGATIAFERAQLDALRRLAAQQAAEADAALGRIDAGTYGSCETCGRPIGQGRLDARPTARHCIDCASGRRGA